MAFGEIKNASTNALFNLTAMVELRDAGNTLVGTWSGAITPNPIPPGGVTQFTIETQHRIEGGQCRVYVSNPIGRTVLTNREYRKIKTQTSKGTDS